MPAAVNGLRRNLPLCSRLPCVRGGGFYEVKLGGVDKEVSLLHRRLSSSDFASVTFRSATFPAGEGDPLPSVPGKHLLRRRPLTCRRHASLVKHAYAYAKRCDVDFVRNLASLITSHSSLATTWRYASPPLCKG